MKYNVSIEKEGKLYRAGILEGTDHNDVGFTYDSAYLKDPAAVALSISLPLEEMSFNPVKTRNFFDGMLPEGFIRHSLAERMHLDENDYISILSNLGRECIGAVRISKEDEVSAEKYIPVTDREIEQLAAEGAAISTEIVTKTHLSLAGASGKVGLYYDPGSDTWYLPVGTAPSTHIVKQSHVRYKGIVANERLSMLTAAKCGIDTAESFIVNTGAAAESEVLYATKRYDRIITDSSEKIGTLVRPNRLHQEDFAQALGISSSQKYEKAEDHYMAQMFKVLREYSADPIQDQLKLWDRVIFNYLIGNTDSHIKNYSLLYSPDMRSIRLAPAYDIVSTVVYENSTREMSMKIGNAIGIDDVTSESFEQAASDIGLGRSLAMKRYDMMFNRFENSLREAADELNEEGFRTEMDLCGQILGRFALLK